VELVTVTGTGTEGPTVPVTEAAIDDARRRKDFSSGSPLDGVEVGVDGLERTRSFPLDHAGFRGTRHFPALDGLRALSVLLVYFFHASDHRTHFLSGWEGVTIFFLLSGFLITTLLLREHEDTGRISLGAFYVRRIFRIFPLYFFVLGLHYVLIVGLGIGGHAEQLSKAMPYYLTYMSEWVAGTPGTPFLQSWSLGIEEKYYLVWPFFIGLLLRGSLRMRLGVVAALVLVPYLTLPIDMTSSRREIVFTAYGRILIGCLIALCLNDRRIFARLRFAGTPAWSVAIVCAFVVSLLLVSPVTGMIYVFPFVAGLLLISLMIGNGFGSRLLSHRAVRYVGTRAYGIYLLDSLAHRAGGYVTPAVTNWPTTLLFFVANFAVAFVIADVLYRVLERPFIALGKRLSSRVMTATAA
jgi:peptidoglycan/LPS O-acetylase OafA/YrhL